MNDHDQQQHRPFADEGELQASLNALREQMAGIDRRNTEGMARIEAQTSKTNGRVTLLELRYAFLSGGLALLALLFAGGVAWYGLLHH